VQLLAMWTAGLLAGVRAGKSIQASVGRERPDKARIQQTHDPAPVLFNLRHPVIRNRDEPKDRRKTGGHQCPLRGRRRCGRPQGEKGRRQEPLIRPRSIAQRLDPRQNGAFLALTHASIGGIPESCGEFTMIVPRGHRSGASTLLAVIVVSMPEAGAENNASVTRAIFSGSSSRASLPE